jgi:hypothetical protein
MRSLIEERVRAKPAWDGTVAGGFGWVSWALGLTELFAPRVLLDLLGVDEEAAPIVRGFGLREIASGVAILQNPIGPPFLWARVVGDVLDLAALGVAMKKSKRPERVGLALGVVGAITLMDILMSLRLTQISAAKRARRAG